MVRWMRDIFEFDQPKKNLNSSDREDFEQQVRLTLCDCGNAQTDDPV